MIAALSLMDPKKRGLTRIAQTAILNISKSFDVR